jgi:hypothetical protein
LLAAGAKLYQICNRHGRLFSQFPVNFSIFRELQAAVLGEKEWLRA